MSGFSYYIQHGENYYLSTLINYKKKSIMPAKVTQYKVIKTFDSPKGLQRRGEIVTFKNAKEGERMRVEGFVEYFTEPKVSRRKKADEGDESAKVLKK